MSHFASEASITGARSNSVTMFDNYSECRIWILNETFSVIFKHRAHWSYIFSFLNDEIQKKKCEGRRHFLCLQNFSGSIICAIDCDAHGLSVTAEVRVATGAWTNIQFSIISSSIFWQNCVARWMEPKLGSIFSLVKRIFDRFSPQNN